MKQFILPFLMLILFASCSVDASPPGFTAESVVTVPDFSPEHVLSSTSFTLNQTRNYAVRIRNFGGPNTDQVSFYIQKMDPVLQVIFDGGLTTTEIGPNTWTVNNQDWTVVEQSTRWKFTSKPGVVINTESVIGVSFKATGYGGANWTSSMVPNTGGGDSSTNNNIKVSVGFQVQ